MKNVLVVTLVLILAGGLALFISRQPPEDGSISSKYTASDLSVINPNGRKVEVSNEPQNTAAINKAGNVSLQTSLNGRSPRESIKTAAVKRQPQSVHNPDCESVSPNQLDYQSIPTNFSYNMASDQQLEDRAMAGDDYAQQYYATRLQVKLLNELPRLEFFNDKDRERWDREFELMQEMYITAIKNGRIESARLLGDTLYIAKPKRNRIEAAAWFKIEEKMGGSHLERLNSSHIFELREEEEVLAESLANIYIDQYNLKVFRQPPTTASYSKETCEMNK